MFTLLEIQSYMSNEAIVISLFLHQCWLVITMLWERYFLDCYLQLIRPHYGKEITLAIIFNKIRLNRGNAISLPSIPTLNLDIPKRVIRKLCENVFAKSIGVVTRIWFQVRAPNDLCLQVHMVVVVVFEVRVSRPRITEEIAFSFLLWVYQKGAYTSYLWFQARECQIFLSVWFDNKIKLEIVMSATDKKAM
jgi:hypothetical protein